jgi:uncharacterized tellurite resistance protein B-like protein
MLKKLAAIFDDAFGRESDDPAAREHALRIATALLLIEVGRADYAEDLAEDTMMVASLKQFFALDETAANLLLAEARSTADQAVELQQFTRRLHEQLSVAEKQRVVEMLWHGGSPARQARRSTRATNRRTPIRFPLRSHPHPQPCAAGLSAAHSSTKNCFLKRTVKRLGSLLGVASTV